MFHITFSWQWSQVNVVTDFGVHQLHQPNVWSNCWFWSLTLVLSILYFLTCESRLCFYHWSFSVRYYSISAHWEFDKFFAPQPAVFKVQVYCSFENRNLGFVVTLSNINIHITVLHVETNAYSSLPLHWILVSISHTHNGGWYSIIILKDCTC